MDNLKENLDKILQNIKEKASKSGWAAEEITLVAVTKTVGIEEIKEAIALGIRDIGENKVQEALAKYSNIKEKVNWHLIGHLQTNKVKPAVRIFDLIHSVDTWKLAQEIDRQARRQNKIQKILVEINLSGEVSKYGCPKEEAFSLIRDITKLTNTRLLGLMTMAPLTDNQGLVRGVFRQLKDLSIKINDQHFNNVEMKYLSMGMTGDFEIALEEGANILRIGTGIFGERKVK